MGKLRWTREAQRWLEIIHGAIAEDDAAAAHRTVEGIRSKARTLTEYPGIGHRYPELPDRDVRILLYGHYRIAYLVKTAGDIDVLGVFHGALDIDRYLA